MPSRTRASLRQLHARTKAKRRLPASPALVAEPARYPVGPFGPQHGLTIAQAIVCNRLLAKAERRQPLTDPLRYRLRLGGIISSVKAGRVTNAAWGRRMLATRGGRKMALHAWHHLRRIAFLGAEASQQARERRLAAQFFEATGTVLLPGEQPPRDAQEQHLRTIQKLWEEAQWLTQQAKLSRW